MEEAQFVVVTMVTHKSAHNISFVKAGLTNMVSTNYLY